MESFPGGTRRATLLAVSAVLALTLALPAGAGATAAGSNGRIFYQGPQSGTSGPADIFSVEPLGGEPLDLTKENGFSEERPSASANGRVVFMSFRDEGWNIFLMNADGTGIVNLTKTKYPAVTNFEPTISPDGSEVVYMRQDSSGQDLWRVGADGSNPENLTEAVGEETSPEFSADGTRIAYVGSGPKPCCDPEYNNDIWVMDADGSNQTQLTKTSFPRQNLSPTWSPDGTKIAYTTTEAGGENGFHVMNANGSGDSGPLPSGSPVAAYNLSWSPDGTKIAYQPTAGGLWVMSPDGTGATPLVANTGAAYPSWAPAGSSGGGGETGGGSGSGSTPGPPPPAAGPPSNEFTFGKVKLNKKKGTAALTVSLPGPGKLVLGGKGVKAATTPVAAAGKATLAIKAIGKALKKLNSTGATSLGAKVTFTPTGGSPRTKTKSLTLKKQP
jgi:WD40 repeat protein